MNLAQNIITNILTEKASIDWNNFLTPEEVEKFLSKDDKVESAEEIIYRSNILLETSDKHYVKAKSFIIEEERRVPLCVLRHIIR